MLLNKRLTIAHSVVVVAHIYPPVTGLHLTLNVGQYAHFSGTVNYSHRFIFESSLTRV